MRLNRGLKPGLMPGRMPCMSDRPAGAPVRVFVCGRGKGVENGLRATRPQNRPTYISPHPPALRILPPSSANSLKSSYSLIEGLRCAHPLGYVTKHEWGLWPPGTPSHSLLLRSTSGESMKNRNFLLGSNGDLTFQSETELSVLLWGFPPLPQWWWGGGSPVLLFVL